MRFYLSIFIGFFCFSLMQAQITDSIAPSKKIDTLLTNTKIESPKHLRQIIDTTFIVQTLDSSKVEKLVRIRKSLLDSLLSPYYDISYDTVAKDTIFKRRYRLFVNKLTNDSTYVPLPKKERFIKAKRKYGFDTLKIANQVRPIHIDSTKMAAEPVWWKRENKIGLAINEAAFANWSAGGENNIAGLLRFSMIRKFQKLYTLWNNEIFVNYGLNVTEDKGTRKTDDKVQINSTFGYRRDTISNWYYSAKFSFNTQLTDGYKYPDTDNPISRFFAPAYLYFGAGTEYNLKKQQFSVYLSPLTLKSTFVMDETLSNDGAFGVEPGHNARNEFGIFVESSWEKKLWKNVVMNNRLSLYTDYVNNFGNIDVDWIFNLKLTVNKWINANIGTQLVYDDDIKYKEDTNGDGQLETLGARVQFKQALNIGVAFSF